MTKARILPQNDSNSSRASELATVRAQYVYDYSYGVPVCAQFQERDKASLLWTLKVLRALYKNRSNTDAVVKNTGWNFQKPLPHKSPAELAKDLANKDMKALFAYYNPELGQIQPTGRPKSRDDYQKIFQKEPRPYNADHYLEDAYFAHTFTAGPNPMMLNRMLAPLPNFPLNDSVFRSVKGFESDSLEQALAQGRVYFTSYADLTILTSGQHPQQPKYIYQPIVAFARPLQSNTLTPIAIQCGQSPQQHPLLTPNDGWAWQIAKGTVWTAHNCYHEILTHLAYTHLLIEPIAIATRRQLHETHPIHALLTPHFEGTMPINFLAVTKLIQPGEAVDRVVGSEKVSNYAAIAKYRLAFSFKDNYFPKRSALYGIDDRKALPVHHYRDDAAPIWNALHQWISAYVDISYPQELSVQTDTELQAWAAEISSAKGGQVKDFASNGGIKDKAELIDTLTMIIFTAGPQHAAVNFPQRTDLSFIPGGMMSGYRVPPQNKQMSEQDYLDFLPPLDVALKQCQSTSFLGSVYHTRLGDYGNIFPEAPIQAALKNFQNTLKEQELKVQAANKTRLSYEHLLPSRIPQSTNI